MVPAATAILLLMLALLAPSAASAQRTRSVPLAPADIDAIVQLVKLEDTRTFDDAVLTRLVNAAAVQPLLRMTEDGPRGPVLGRARSLARCSGARQADRVADHRAHAACRARA